jgi:hypothetical protein
MSPLVGVSFELVAVEGVAPLSLAFFRTGCDGVAVCEVTGKLVREMHAKATTGPMSNFGNCISDPPKCLPIRASETYRPSPVGELL